MGLIKRLLTILAFSSVAWAVPLNIPQVPATKTLLFPAGGWETDGAVCVGPTRHQVNDGPFTSTITCTNSASGRVDFHTRMPKSYTGGPVKVTLNAEHEGGAPSGALVLDVSCMCRSPSEAINGTWGTAGSVFLPFSAQFRPALGTSGNITCNGSCTTRKTMVFVRATVNSGSTTTDPTQAYILDAGVEFPVDALSD